MTFDQNVSLHLNGEEARLIYLPDAHTDSDVVVWFKGSNVLHTGDAYAGGFLYGLTQGYELAKCAHIGSIEPICTTRPSGFSAAVIASK